MSELTVEKVSELKVTELKEHLAARKLDTKGKKAELVSRLEEALKKEKEQKVKAGATPVATTPSPKTSAETKKEEQTKTTPTPTTTSAPTGPPTSVSLSTTAPTSASTPAAPSPSNVQSNQDNDRLLTEEEKRQRRAERFKTELSSSGHASPLSGAVDDEDKMKQRAARFGVTQSLPPGKGVLGDSKMIERAKRFGVPIKQAGSAQVSQARLQQRINRFKSPNMTWTPNSTTAAPTAASTTTGPVSRKSAESITGTSVSDEEERKRKRAERFAAGNGEATKKQKVNE